MMKHSTLKYISVAAVALVMQFGHASGALAASGKEQGSVNGQPFLTLQDRIDVLSVNLAEAVAYLQQQIDELVASGAEQDVLIAALQSAVASLETRVTQNETDIVALYEWHYMQGQLIAALENELAILAARVAANENDIAALILADQAMQQAIDAIKQDIVVLNQMVALNISDIGALQAEVDSLQAALADMQAQLAGKQDLIAGICGPGSSIRQISANGDVTCEVDSVSEGVGTLVSVTVYNWTYMPSSTVVRQERSTLATCPSTHRVSGGGHNIGGGSLGTGNINRSRPLGNGWMVRAVSKSVGRRSLYGYAVCLLVR
jgi:acyl transferase domain-containing protein